MQDQIPEKFARTTRWAYVNKANFEVGPFSAAEVVEMLRKREVTPDTMLVELNSRRTCPLKEVGPFARVVVDMVETRRKEKADADFLKSTEALSSGGRRTVLWVVIAGGLVAAVAAAAVIVVNPFAAPKKEQQQALKTTPQTSEVPAAETKQEPEKKAEPGFQILEADGPDGPDDEEMVESLLEEHQLAPTSKTLANGEKLEGPARLDPIHRPRSNGGHKAKKAAEEEAGGGVYTLDFTDDTEEEGAGDLASRRLRSVVQRCATRSLHRFNGVEHVVVRADARLQSDGKIKSLKLEVNPRRGVGEMKMCASAELMRLRVPPFEGSDVPLSTTVTLAVGP